MKWKIFAGFVFATLVISVGTYVWLVTNVSTEPLEIEDIMPPLPTSPNDTTFDIDGNEITLQNGRFEMQSAPDSASRDSYSLSGDEVRGDVNADGSEDVLHWLTYNGGGSGTFFYLVVAVWDVVGYRGSNAIPLGDRIVPVSLEIWHDIVRIIYRTHAEGQSLGEQPVEEVTRYFMVQGAQVIELGPIAQDEEVVTGHVVWNDDEAQITSCDKTTSTIDPASRAGAALKAIYTARSAETASSTPVFVVVGGAYQKSAVSDTEEGKRIFTISSVLSAPEFDRCDTYSITDEPKDVGDSATTLNSSSSTTTQSYTN